MSVPVKLYILPILIISLATHIGRGLNHGGDDGPVMAWLEADTYEVSAISGGWVTLYLDADRESWYREYIILGSMSGAAVGIPMPGGKAVLPLKWDAYTDHVLSNLNTSWFEKFSGVLDGVGKATAKLVIPPLSQEDVGTRFFFAYSLCRPYDLVSQPVMIEIVP